MICLVCHYGEDEEYKGSKNTTVSGRTCQHWESDSPHEKDWKPSLDPENYPEKSLSQAENFCRMLKHPLPWCYTTDTAYDKKWEHCFVEPCEKGKKGSQYLLVITLFHLTTIFC